MNRKLVIGSLAGVLALAASVPAFAVTETGEKSTVTERLGSTTESVVRKTEDTVRKSTTVVENVTSQRDQIEQKKSSLRDDLHAMRAEAKEKLAGQRLAQCQNRQKHINELIEKSVANGRERLTRIQKFENGVREFYQKKELSSEQFAAVSANVDEKEAAATAALDVMDAETFECAKVDGAKPSGTIKATHQAKRLALDEYRDSVREMIKVVKAAFAASQSPETEGATE